MQALILVGGLGTRLRPLTYTRPKPLLPVANTPLVDHLIEKVPEDVTRIVLAGGYRMGDLEAHFAAREDLGGREIVLVEEEERMGTAGAIKHAGEHLTEPFLVLNGDVLSSLDLDAFRAFHGARGGAGSIALWEVEDPRHFGVMRMEGDQILEFVEKPETLDEAPSRLANAGTYLLEPEVLERIPPGRKVSIERETFPELLDDGGELFGFPFTGWWVDCGRPETYLRAHELVLRHRGTDRAVDASATMDGTVEGWVSVGADATVDAGATLTRSVLLPGARVEEGATVVDSVLGEGATVGAGARVEGSVLGDGVRVDAGSVVKGARLAPPGHGDG